MRQMRLSIYLRRTISLAEYILAIQQDRKHPLTVEEVEKLIMLRVGGDNRTVKKYLHALFTDTRLADTQLDSNRERVVIINEDRLKELKYDNNIVKEFV